MAATTPTAQTNGFMAALQAADLHNTTFTGHTNTTKKVHDDNQCFGVLLNKSGMHTTTFTSEQLTELEACPNCARNFPDGVSNTIRTARELQQLTDNITRQLLEYQREARLRNSHTGIAHLPFHRFVPTALHLQDLRTATQRPTGTERPLHPAFRDAFKQQAETSLQQLQTHVNTWNKTADWHTTLGPHLITKLRYDNTLTQCIYNQLETLDVPGNWDHGDVIEIVTNYVNNRSEGTNHPLAVSTQMQRIGHTNLARLEAALDQTVAGHIDQQPTGLTRIAAIRFGTNLHASLDSPTSKKLAGELYRQYGLSYNLHTLQVCRMHPAMLEGIHHQLVWNLGAADDIDAPLHEVLPYVNHIIAANDTVHDTDNLWQLIQAAAAAIS